MNFGIILRVGVKGPPVQIEAVSASQKPRQYRAFRAPFTYCCFQLIGQDSQIELAIVAFKNHLGFREKHTCQEQLKSCIMVSMVSMEPAPSFEVVLDEESDEPPAENGYDEQYNRSADMYAERNSSAASRQTSAMQSPSFDPEEPWDEPPAENNDDDDVGQDNRSAGQAYEYVQPKRSKANMPPASQRLCHRILFRLAICSTLLFIVLMMDKARRSGKSLRANREAEKNAMMNGNVAAASSSAAASGASMPASSRSGIDILPTKRPTTTSPTARPTLEPSPSPTANPTLEPSWRRMSSAKMIPPTNPSWGLGARSTLSCIATPL